MMKSYSRQFIRRIEQRGRTFAAPDFFYLDEEGGVTYLASAVSANDLFGELFFTLVLQPSGHKSKAGCLLPESSVETNGSIQDARVLGEDELRRARLANYQQRGEGTNVPCNFKVVAEPRFLIKTALESGTYFQSVPDRDGELWSLYCRPGKTEGSNGGGPSFPRVPFDMP